MTATRHQGCCPYRDLARPESAIEAEVGYPRLTTGKGPRSECRAFETGSGHVNRRFAVVDAQDVLVPRLDCSPRCLNGPAGDVRTQHDLVHVQQRHVLRWLL